MDIKVPCTLFRLYAFNMVNKKMQIVIFTCVISIAYILFTKVDNVWLTTRTSATKQPHYDDNRERLYEDRRNTVLKGCAIANRPITNSLEATNNYIDVLHKINYCPIPKVGSTFWKRVLTVITSNGRLNSPYEITLKNGTEHHSWKSLSEDSKKALENDSDSILFVRDPYARLFSGYENKIYHPNKAFWKSVGSTIVKTVRPNHKDVQYGYDVTFPELVKYIIHTHEQKVEVNGHFTPMNKWCDPCRTHYKYIGHLETITDDAEYLLSKWRRDFSDVTLRFDDIYQEAALDTARGHLRDLFTTQPLLSDIKAPFINLMLRTWRDFQIRGYMSKHIAFPYHGDVSKVTSDDFRAKIVDALTLPQNRTANKLQRTEALVQAYRQVPLEDMEKLRKFVLTDCELFGYNDRPSKLFDRTHATYDDFLYLDGLSNEPYQ